MNYLIAAYLSVWVILAWMIGTLMQRNSRLTKQLKEMEARIAELEQASGTQETSAK